MKLEVDVKKRLGAFTLDIQFSTMGNRLGIFGPSGSGKSTLVRLLAGLDAPDSGIIKLDGEVLSDRQKSVTPHKRRIGVVFQDSHLFTHLGVRENLLYGYKRLPRAERKIDPDELIEALDLGALMQRGVHTLSGGERRRVALGRAVLASPRLLLLDEPLTGLDDKLRYQIIPYLHMVLDRFGIPTLFISHSVEEMRLMTNRVLLLEGGGFAGEIKPAELAMQSLARGQEGYVNLMRLCDPSPVGDLCAYQWGDNELILLDTSEAPRVMARLEARDVVLFKNHPTSASARNLLTCTVSGLVPLGNRVAVELLCGGQLLVSQIVREAVVELGLREGSVVVAAIKATSFRILYGEPRRRGRGALYGYEQEG
ncbi:MAG: molybdenum ABC transporter ATP-binding protein [Deltaproteobacteria bacterium]|nr:MAG: molybdenum ABC transporter ATP-binding protein [Deltaproteobacteria bacterium]